MREKLQQFGGFMAGMVIPNIGAILAWGLITALFIPTGWIPNETFAKLVDPMIIYLIPVADWLHGRQDGLRSSRWCGRRGCYHGCHRRS